MMLPISPRAVYLKLRFLDQADSVTGAQYRQLAQDILADRNVSLGWRQAIADRLNRANHLLEMKTATDNDSY